MQETFKQGELILISDEGNVNWEPRVFSHMKEGKFICFCITDNIEGRLQVGVATTPWDLGKKYEGKIHKDFINKQPKLLNFNFY